ncbi:MAG: L-serine ammonia-lyase, iron-sulfur-dependent, subunit alpha, partial [Bacteroidales bacterium]|nr:L-serine ammonia-lyase, iron-sulfur-dependent, subunit alpha [Bacteroidales bacterium]
IAAALGAVCGKSGYGLEVLKDISEKSLIRAKELVNSKKVCISVADTDEILYVKATVIYNGKDNASATIRKDHDNITETSLDGKILFSCNGNTGGAGKCRDKAISDYQLSVKEIYRFATETSYDDIKFILEDKKLNLALSNEGLSGEYGLRVGKTIMENQDSVFGDDFMSYAMALTSAASDARMAGCSLPAMSNSGSGNQGITVSMPVIAYALKYGVEDEDLARALIISNLLAIHIKGYLGKLSALCGCVVAATGSSCGIVYLKGGSYKEICSAIKNMIGNITGMVCDGAKVGCAMKVASGVSCAIQSAVLALKGICISENDGIIEKDIEKTISNLGSIGKDGMKNTDNMILKIMACK